MNTKFTPSVADEDLEATAELPVVDFAPAAEDSSVSGASTDVFPVPAIPAGTSELADRLREVEQRLHRKSERVRQQEILLDEVGARLAGFEAQLTESRRRQAELETQLEEARTHAQRQSQLTVEIRATASRHEARDFTELRSRNERLLEALTSWQGFRSMSDALLAEAEARNELLESQLATLDESLRARQVERVRAAAPVEPAGGNAVLRTELASLKSEVGALQTELLVVLERQQQSEQKAQTAAIRARNLEAEIQASVVMFGDSRKHPQQPDPGDTGTVAQLKVPPVDASRVLIRQDGDIERIHPVGRRTTIGRTPDNEIQIDAHNVSRHHAVLLSSAEHCIVEDLNSTNGVLVNGRRVVRQALRDGDTVTVGKTEFRFRHRP